MKMNDICEACKEKDSCSYIKQGKADDCIVRQYGTDAPTSDYSWEEAMEDGIKDFCLLKCNEDEMQECALNPDMRCLMYKIFAVEIQ